MSGRGSLAGEKRRVKEGEDSLKTRRNKELSALLRFKGNISQINSGVGFQLMGSRRNTEIFCNAKVTGTQSDQALKRRLFKPILSGQTITEWHRGQI